MRRLAISLTAVGALLLASVAPVAADTFYPAAGTYRYTQTFNLTCDTVACDNYVYVQTQTYAIQYQDGSRRVCAGAVTSTDINTQVHEFGCSDTPGAFTFDHGWLVSWADTSVDLHNTLSGDSTRTVHVSASVAIAGGIQRNNQATVYTDTGTGCTYRVNEKYQFATGAGTLTFDGTTLPLNEAGQPQTMEIADFSKPMVKCPR